MKMSSVSEKYIYQFFNGAKTYSNDSRNMSNIECTDSSNGSFPCDSTTSYQVPNYTFFCITSNSTCGDLDSQGGAQYNTSCSNLLNNATTIVPHNVSITCTDSNCGAYPYIITYAGQSWAYDKDYSEYCQCSSTGFSACTCTSSGLSQSDCCTSTNISAACIGSQGGVTS